MNFNPDDPKWTAYVLGELDPSEHAEIDTLLENSEDARAYVQELRDATFALHEEMKLAMLQPSISGLTREQRAAVHAAAGSTGRNGRARWFNWNATMVAGAMAVAALILFAVVLPAVRKSGQNAGTYQSVMKSVETSKEETESQAATDTATLKDSGKVAENEAKQIAKADAALKTESQPAAVLATPTTQGIDVPRTGIETPVQPPVSNAQGNLGTAKIAVNHPAAEPAEKSEKKEVIGAPVQGGQLRNLPLVGTIIPGTAGISSIGGVIQDPMNALIPGVTVTASNAITGVTATALTNDSGVFSFSSLAPGPYTITAELSGFQKTTVPNINLGNADSQRVNMKLNLGNSSQVASVSVEAGKVLRESSASVGDVLTANQVQNLPLVGNNVLELLATLPGVRTEQQARNSPNTVNTTRDGLGVNPNSSLSKDTKTGDALLNLPDNQDDLLVYLTQLAEAKGGAGNGNVTVSVDGFQGQGGQQAGQGQAKSGNNNNNSNGNAAGQGQGQGQRAAGGGGGGGRGGGGAAGGGRGGNAAAAGGAPAGARGGAPAAGAAPPPPPPAPPAARATPAPAASPARIDGVNNNDRTIAPGGNYSPVVDNPFRRVSDEPLSTFSSDVDTASYANLRRFLTQNQAPPHDAVRIEEMINYFNYDYPQPTGSNPIGAQLEVASAPWSPSHRLVRIGVKARDIDTRRRDKTNLVFLIDVSGSMQPPERLPLIKSGLKMLTNQLGENDHVAIVVYAGSSGVALQSTDGGRKDVIMRALDNLEAGGSTNGSAGIQLAYQIASNNFIPGGVNRVILATDGDFNLGVVNQNDMVRMIQDNAKTGVFLTVLGVGTDNLNDSMMKKLADNGNGHYAYLDSQNEAYKVLVEQMGGTLVTVAKDVKLQVEFNPAVVEAYRLIGYENRLLANADFNNDRKDAGDMGAGHTVTALYEIVPRGGDVPGPNVDPLKYQIPAADRAVAPAANRNASNEMLTLKIRYKEPTGTESKLISLPLVDRKTQFSRASADFRFAASVAEFGMILRDSPYRGKASISDVLENAQGSKGTDRNGYRQEFIGLVSRARTIRGIE